MKSSRSDAPEPSPEQIELIDSLGGPKAVADYLSARLERAISPSMVSNWKRRGIPFRYRAAMALQAGELEVGVPEGFLGEGVKPPPPPTSSSQVPWLD